MSRRSEVQTHAAPRKLLAVLLIAAPFVFAAMTNVRAQTDAPPQAAQKPTPQQTPTPDGEAVERIDTDLTSVLLTTMDKSRRFVTTLTKDDVRVVEDGVEQRLSSFERETDAPLSLALLVDTSASQEKVMGDERETASAFVRSVLRPDRDTASVLSFTGITRLDQPLTNDADKLLSSISRLKVEYTEDSPVCKNKDAPEDIFLRCRTGVFDSVVISISEVLSKTPEQTRRAIILLSDGDDTVYKTPIYRAIEYAVRANVVIYSIGIRDKHFKDGEMRRDYLSRLADETGGRAFFPKDARDLSAAFAQIESELRSQYLITYTPTNRATDGTFRRLQIEITNPALRKQKLRLFYRQGYYAKKTMNAERGTMN